MSDDEPKIIIGVCVSVLGLILLLVAVGIVTKIYKEKYKNAFTLHEFLKKDKNYFRQFQHEHINFFKRL